MLSEFVQKFLTAHDKYRGSEDGKMDDPEHEPTDEARTRAANSLDQIARLAKHRLGEHGIDLDLLFLVPSTGAILIFGTMADPSDDLWAQVSALVCEVVKETVGIEHFRCRHLVCAAADGASP
jgi:hypothetical protein